MRALSERLFLSTVGEERACEDAAHRALEYWMESFFSRFIGLEWLNTHTCMCQNACLFKYPHNHSNLGLKWKQTADKEDMQ